jgi:hypothetical protein
LVCVRALISLSRKSGVRIEEVADMMSILCILR